MTSILPDDPLRSALLQAAWDAGSRIMQDWGREPMVIRKPDGSPVTLTDAAAERIVVEVLKAHSPYPVIAEEAMHDGPAPSIEGTPFWLVDALDGTREFIRGGKDFTVNVALIENTQPVFGIIHAPVHQRTWWAAAGRGALRIEGGQTTRIAMRAIPAEGVHLLAGKQASQPGVLSDYLGEYTVAKTQQRSSALKFCLVAEGSADIYPRKGNTYEWDTAAGDIIVREAGGAVIDLETKKPIVYGKAERNFENGGFIAGARAAFKLQDL